MLVVILVELLEHPVVLVLQLAEAGVFLLDLSDRQPMLFELQLVRLLKLTVLSQDIFVFGFE